MEWKAGKKILIRCQVGCNRSGLVMAIVLMKEGYSAKDSIDQALRGGFIVFKSYGATDPKVLWQNV